jgi:hypothetical protein
MVFLRSQHTLCIADWLKLVVLGGVLIMPSYSLASDITDHLPEKERTKAVEEEKKGELSTGHRHIEGKVESVQDDLIKVDTDVAGGMTPRFITLNKQQGDKDIKKGDLVQLEVNAQNQVIKFKKVKGSGKQ